MVGLYKYWDTHRLRESARPLHVGWCRFGLGRDKQHLCRVGFVNSASRSDVHIEVILFVLLLRIIHR